MANSVIEGDVACVISDQIDSRQLKWDQDQSAHTRGQGKMIRKSVTGILDPRSDLLCKGVEC